MLYEGACEDNTSKADNVSCGRYLDSASDWRSNNAVPSALSHDHDATGVKKRLCATSNSCLRQ